MFADSESLTTPALRVNWMCQLCSEIWQICHFQKSQRSFLKSMHKMICTTACVYVTYNATAESNVQLFSPLNTTEVCGDGPTAD